MSALRNCYSKDYNGRAIGTLLRDVPARPLMIIFLYGSDSYRREQKAQELIAAYRAKHSGLQQFDLAESDQFLKLKDFSATFSMFEPIKMAFVTNLSEVDKPDELLIPFLRGAIPSKDFVLLISEADTPSAAFDFLLQKPIQSQEFAELEGQRLKFFIEQETKRRGYTLQEDVRRLLEAAYTGDSWGLVTELDKLALMRKPEFETPLALSQSYFALLAKLKSSHTSAGGRLAALERIFSDHKEDPARVFNSIAYKANSPEEGELLADYDVAVKSGKLDYEEVLLDLALS